MLTLDYHLHSRHSADSQASLDEMAEAALARGLREVCFTEHLDFDRDDPDYGFFRYGPFREAIEAARARWAGRLTIRSGLEFDFRRAYGTEVGEVLATMEVDYLLGSVHSAAGWRIFRLAAEDPPGLDVPDLLDDYFAEVEALAASGWCHAIGHFDYVYKQLPARVAALRGDGYWRQVEGVLRRCIAGGVALEVNTHHLLDRGWGMAADAEILRRYRALGGRLVTVGSDAHRPGDVAHAFAEAEEALRDAGFSAVYGYERGRSHAVPIGG